MNSSHDSVELRDQGNDTLLTFGANARVTNQNSQFGNFIVEYIDGQPIQAALVVYRTDARKPLE